MSAQFVPTGPAEHSTNLLTKAAEIADHDPLLSVANNKLALNSFDAPLTINKHELMQSKSRPFDKIEGVKIPFHFFQELFKIFSHLLKQQFSG